MAKRGPKPKYKTAAEFEAKVDEYFEYCEEKKRMTTVAGLMHFCGFANKSSFLDQEKRTDDPDFARVVGRARLKLEDEAWNRGKGIDIFYLKNHYDMSDNQKFEHTGPGGKPIAHKWTIEITDDAENPPAKRS